jgi:hypothetical protein
MGPLDEISVAIGELRQGHAMAAEERRELRKALGDLTATVSANTAAVAAATTAIAAMAPQVEAGKRARWVGIGVLGAIGALTGALGSKIGMLLGIVSGGGHP